MVILASLLLKLSNDPLVEYLEAIDWRQVEFLVNAYEAKRRRRGRKGFPILKKLKLMLVGYLKGIRSPTAIARLTRNWVFREISGFSKEVSHDCANDFINTKAELLEQVFCLAIARAIKLGLISGKQQAIDTTKIASPYKKSSDGKWSYDDVRSKQEGKDCYYFGYGAMLNFDTKTHLPLALVAARSRKVNTKLARACLAKTPLKPSLLHADAEFDIIILHQELLKQGVFPLVPINPRRKLRTRKKYRVEKLMKLPKNIDLDKLHQERAEADHAISTLKERFGLEEIHLKSLLGITSHLLLCCLHRVIDALAVHKNYPDEPVRRSFICL